MVLVPQIGMQGVFSFCELFGCYQGPTELPAPLGKPCTVFAGRDDGGWLDGEADAGQFGKYVLQFNGHVAKAVAFADQLVVLFDPFVDVVRQCQGDPQILAQAGGELHFGIRCPALGGDTEGRFPVFGVGTVKFQLNLADINRSGVVGSKGRSGQGGTGDHHGK